MLQSQEEKSRADTFKTISCREGMLQGERGFHAPGDAYVCLLPFWQMMGSITRAAEAVCYRCTPQNRCATYYNSIRCKEAQAGRTGWSKQQSTYPLRDMQPANRSALLRSSMGRSSHTNCRAQKGDLRGWYGVLAAIAGVRRRLQGCSRRSSQGAGVGLLWVSGADSAREIKETRL